METTASTALALPAIKQPVSSGKMEAIEKAAKDFEAIFVTEMLKPMFEGTGSEDPVFGGSSEEGIFKSLMITEFGNSISDAGGIGIAQHIKKELLRLQEAQN